MVLLCSPLAPPLFGEFSQREIYAITINRTKKISYDEINYESVAISFKDKQVNFNYILIHNHHFNHFNSIAIATRLAIIISNSRANSLLSRFSPVPCRHLTKVRM